MRSDARKRMETTVPRGAMRADARKRFEESRNHALADAMAAEIMKPEPIPMTGILFEGGMK